MTGSTLLGIDLGTQSLKVVIYDAGQQRIAATASSPLTVDEDSSGKAEQDPNAWLDALAAALHEIDPELRRNINAIGVSGQQHGLVALDIYGKPLRPAKLWCDTTTEAEADEIMAAVGGRRQTITLAGNALVTGFTAPKILWLRKNEAAHYDAMSDILLPHDFINFALTGEKRMEYGDASGTGLLDVRKRSWCTELLDAIDSSRAIGDCLPPLVEPGEFIGETTAAAGARFGIPAGIPVATGGGDNMMAAIGTGNVRNGTLTMSLGTSGTLFAHSDAPVIDPKGNIAAFCGSAGGWLPLLCTMNCTYATELMRNLLDVDVAGFDAAIDGAPPGAGGLIALPFFNGERTPNLPDARASLVGLNSTNTSKGHLLRATVEGATFALKFGIDELGALGLDVREIVLTGGGANSHAWRRIVADVIGLTVRLLDQNEGAGFGAALQALWTLERDRNPNLAISDITDAHVAIAADASVEPDADTVAAYASVYGNYREVLEQMIPLMTRPPRTAP